MNLENTVAVVTGSARGIGLAISKGLANRGANIVLNDVVDQDDAAEAINIVKALGGQVLYVQADISQTAQSKKLMEEAVREFSRIDLLVNNAGITRDNLLLRMKEDDWDAVIAINLKGTFNCMQAAAKYMMKQRSGSIVNISSIVGVYGNAGQANYSASKAGVIGLTKTAAKELAPRGIRVNAVAPGFIETTMTKKLPPETREKVVERIPLGKFGGPHDVAALVCFLASKEAGYITGQIIGLDGGLVI
jgi:3-oxoacyl-[acyl-carrier protein] reductase